MTPYNIEDEVKLMSPKKRLHELAKELDLPTERLMEIALRNGMRFSSNFNAIEDEQEERLRNIVLGPLRTTATKPTVRIVKTAKQKAKEEIKAAAEAAEAVVDEPVVAAESVVEVGEETCVACLEGIAHLCRKVTFALTAG